MRVRVEVEVPDRLAWQLDEAAEARGATLRRVLESAVRHQIEVEAAALKSRRRLDMIGDLVRVGIDDGRIAVALGLTRAQVADRRRKLGLRANRRNTNGE